jgi:TRAP-type transport system small permease protein
MSARALLAMVGRVLDWSAAALLFAILCITTARVAGRYLFGISLPWSEELTRLLFIWLILVGAARTRHMSIDLLPDALGPRAALALRLFALALGVGLLALMVRQSFVLIDLTAFDRFTALGVSVQYLYWAVVVGGGLWILLSLARAIWPQDDAGRGAE